MKNVMFKFNRIPPGVCLQRFIVISFGILTSLLLKFNSISTTTLVQHNFRPSVFICNTSFVLINTFHFLQVIFNSVQPKLFESFVSAVIRFTIIDNSCSDSVILFPTYCMHNKPSLQFLPFDKTHYVL